MALIKASRTEANLRYAFATETLTSRWFLAYAAQAEAEGKHHAAALFRDIANRRAGQAQANFEYLEPNDQDSGKRSGIDTACHVRSAIMAELHECSDRYPGMARTAHKEQLTAVAAGSKPLRRPAGRTPTDFGACWKP